MNLRQYVPSAISGLFLGLLVGSTCDCLAAAGPANAYSVNIDPQFNPLQVALIMEAEMAWEDKVGVQFQTTLDPDCIPNSGYYNICVVPATSFEDKRIGETYLYGKTQSSVVYLLVGKDVYGHPVDLQKVATHELGHALGLSHEMGPENIMFWATNSDQKGITCDDAQQYFAVRGESFYCPDGGFVVDKEHQ